MSESRIKQMKRIARIFEYVTICDSDSEEITSMKGQGSLKVFLDYPLIIFIGVAICTFLKSI